jgi:phospho-N-acetylmuramoyl-pentapeptide-transferase
MIMMIVAFLLGLILCLLFGVPYIDFLKKNLFGQYIKDVAPKNHAQKAGTPTTGGVFIVGAIIISSITTSSSSFSLYFFDIIIILSF